MHYSAPHAHRIATHPSMLVVVPRAPRPTADELRRHRRFQATGLSAAESPEAETPSETAARRQRALVYSRFGARGQRRAMTTTVMPGYGMGDSDGDDGGLGKFTIKGAVKAVKATVKYANPIARSQVSTVAKVTGTSERETAKKMYGISDRQFNIGRSVTQGAAAVGGAAVAIGTGFLVAPLLTGGAAAGGAAAGAGTTTTATGATGAAGLLAKGGSLIKGARSVAGSKAITARNLLSSDRGKKLTQQYVAPLVGPQVTPPFVTPPVAAPQVTVAPPSPRQEVVGSRDAEYMKDWRQRHDEVIEEGGTEEQATQAANKVEAGFLSGMPTIAKVGLGLGMGLLVLKMIGKGKR